MTIESKQSPNDAIIGFEYVFPDEIATEETSGSSHVSITLSAGKAWKPIYFTPGSAQLSQQVTNPFQGKTVESKFEMKIPGKNSGMTTDLDRICGRSIVIKLLFESGESLICGGKFRKLRLLFTSSTGTQNGYVVGFEYKSLTEFLWLKTVGSGVEESGSN